MGRRKITEEAEEQANEQEQEANQQDSGSDDVNRYTQRMPDELLKAIDQYADERGMSRNAAVNSFVRDELEKRNYL